MYRHFSCAVALGILACSSGALRGDGPWGGRVVDEKGQPVGGAKVVAWGSEELRELGSTVTADDGQFRFDPKLQDECRLVVATKDGKCLDWAFRGLDGLYRGATTSELPLLRLGQAAAIEGLVVNEIGKPIAGAAVKAWLKLQVPVKRELPFTRADSLLTSTTDPQGRFRFDNLPEAASVGFSISSAGYAGAWVEGPFAPGQKGLRFVLPPEGWIEGTVVEKDGGRPLPNVRLVARGSVTGGMHRPEATTDAAGRFRMAGLSGGNRELELDCKASSTDEAPQIWVGRQEKVQVRTGQVTSDVRIEAVRGGVLVVTLVGGAAGKPIITRGAVFASPVEDRRIHEFAAFSGDGTALFCLRLGNTSFQISPWGDWP